MRYHDTKFAAGLAADRRAGRHVLAGDPGELERVVRSAAVGDPIAWAELVRRFTRSVSSVARSHRLAAHEIEDVVQTTWLRLLEHIGDVRDPEKVGGWLRTTAQRESCRLLKERSREITTGDELDQCADEPTVLDELVKSERSGALARALETATERQRELMAALMAEPEPSYAEVSDALGIPIGSIGPTRLRCIAHLRQDAVLAAVVRED